MTAMSNATENRLIDQEFRGVPSTPVSTLYVALYSSAPSDIGGGTELTGNGYTRATIPCSLSAWAGTQSPGSVGASTGTSGQTSNNVPVTFPMPTAPWGSVSHFAIFDAPTGGTLRYHGPLGSIGTIPAGANVVYPAGTLVAIFD